MQLYAFITLQKDRDKNFRVIRFNQKADTVFKATRYNRNIFIDGNNHLKQQKKLNKKA